MVSAQCICVPSSLDPAMKMKRPPLGGRIQKRDWNVKKTQKFSTLKTSSAPVVLGLALLASPAFAQTPEAAVDSDEIIVTGTLIANPNITSSSPVSVIGADEVELRQVNNAEQIIRDLPGAVPSIGQNVNNGNGGASFVNLRGLGTNRNIVLLDGARIVPSGTGGAVDLNNIPLALIERVDSLTGGASTTYGADAVSGVLNFITRKDFSGLELQLAQGLSERGDGNTFRADLTMGANFDDGRGNATLSVGYQEADPIYQGDRDISVFGISSRTGIAAGESFTSTPTTISFASGLPLGFPDDSDFQINPSGTGLVPFYNGFNFNPYNIFVTPFQRFNIFSSANYEVSDRLEVYARGMYSKNTVSTIIAPSGVFGEPLTVPGNNPYLNATIRDQLCTLNGIALGAGCNTNAAIPLPQVYRRTIELGPRISEYVTQMFDYRVGAKYALTDSIDFDIYGAYGESSRVETRSGYVARSRLQQALNATNTTTCANVANGCVPLNLFGPAGSITPAMAGFIGGITSSVENRASLAQVHAVVSGDIGATSPWAEDPVGFAIGAEHRDYTAETRPDNLAQVPGELGGAGGATLPVNGGYSVNEVFGELIAPLVSDKPFFNELTLEAGVRHSKYKINTPTAPEFAATTYKFGANWAPAEGIKFRGNYQRAVRAPNISELFAPVTTGLTNLQVDPCAGAAPVGNANLTAACLGQGAPSVGGIQNPSAGQANATGGGNPALTPEKAKTYSFGTVLQPSFVPGLTLTVDYYNIVVNTAVTAATPADILADCFGTNPAAITAAQAASVACTSIRRSPTNGRLSGPPAIVFGLPQPLTNRGRLATDGIDFALNYKGDLGFADLSLSFVGNYTMSSEFRASPTSYNRDCVGYFSANCGSIQPKYQWNQRTTLSFDNIDVSLLWRHIASVKYEGAADDFAARGFTAVSRVLFNGTVTNGGAARSPLAGTRVNMNQISAYNYFDLATRFGLSDNLDLTFTVTNLLDKSPPLVGNAAGSTSFNSGNTYPSTYDAVGRRYGVTAKLKF